MDAIIREHSIRRSANVMTQTYRGRVRGGQIVLDDGAVLPEGVQVAVTLIAEESATQPENPLDSEDVGNTGASYAEEVRRRLKQQKSP